MESYKEEFDQWAKKMNRTVYTRLSEVTNSFDNELVTGQKCTFINDNGVKFEGKTILGFCERQNNMFTDEDTRRYVYLDSDSYWFPVKPSSLTLESSFQEFQSSGSKVLLCDVSTPSGKRRISNFHILDKSTGKTEPLKIGDIDLNKQPAESIKKLLSGNKVEMSNKSGINSLVGLNKTVTGWGISAAKQVLNTADESAGI